MNGPPRLPEQRMEPSKEEVERWKAMADQLASLPEKPYG